MANATSNYPSNSSDLTEFIDSNVGLISAMITERHTRPDHLVEEDDVRAINNAAPSAEKDFSRFMPTMTPKLNFE
jgi:hypothetical protein